MEKKKILVLCTGNSCRSQIAHGFLQHMAAEKAIIYSAGIETHGVNPKAIFFMNEIGIDISKHSSNLVSEYADIDFDFVITVCDHAHEKCPVIYSNAHKIHQNFPDPSKVNDSEEEIALAFRNTRNMIHDFCKSFTEKFL